MARTSRAERHRRRESALALVSQGKGFSDVVTTDVAMGVLTFICPAGCRWAHEANKWLHDVQHLIVHIATSLQHIALKAEEDKQYAACWCRRCLRAFAAPEDGSRSCQASRPGWLSTRQHPVLKPWRTNWRICGKGV